MSKFAARNYSFRGKTLEDLQKMDRKDFIGLLPSSRQRYFERNFEAEQIHLLEKIRKEMKAIEGQNGAKPKVVRTHLRRMIVFPEMVDSFIGIYNGKEFVEVQIKPEMIGQVLAEFAPSKKVVKHSRAGVGATRSSSGTSLK